MNNQLSEMYCNWISEQQLIAAWEFEALLEANKELEERAQSSTQNPPDWSTWIQALCS